MKLQQLFAKAQLDLLVIQCAIEGWDKDPDWVNRGKDGKFGGGGVAKATKDAAKGAKEVFDSTAKTLNVTKDAIRLSLSDSGFRERAGLFAGMGMAEIIKATSKAIGKTPELETKIDSLVQQAADKLAKDYGGDKDPLAQAIRKSDGLEPPADSPIPQKMEFAAAKYQLYMEALAQPEKYGYTPAQQQELIGKSIKASIPLVVDLAVNVGVGVAMGLLFRQSLSHALASAVLGEAVYRGLDKGLDAAGVDDPMVKTGIQLTVGLVSSGIVELASKKIAGLATKKVVGEELKKEAKKVVRQSLVKNLEDTIEVKSSSSSLDWIKNSVKFDIGSHKVEMLVDSFNYKNNKDAFSEISFTVNNSFDKQEIASDESRAIMYQLRKSFKQKVKEAEEGQIFRCSAHEEDGFGEQRKAFYKLMGFAEQADGILAGIVKDGKIVPRLD